MSIKDAFLAELEQECAVTRSVLEAIPADKLDFAPHEKSMKLGQLAWHMSTSPTAAAHALKADSFAAEDIEGPTDADITKAAILEHFDTNVGEAKAVLAEMTDEMAKSDWSLTMDGAPIVTLPRAAVIRSFLLNHMIHHRGQLTVYLRMVGATVPSVYGPSADVNPFAAA